MFDGFSCLEELDISHFVNALNNRYMFSGCSKELIKKVKAQNESLDMVEYKANG